MPVAAVNGINLSFDEYGSGEPVILVPGTGAPGRVWKTYQVPALTAAGYRAITIDNRGVPPSDICEGGFTLDDMIGDIGGLIEHLELGPCNIIGSSMGSIVVQELLVARPELTKRAVLMASRGRMDVLGTAMAEAEMELVESGVKLPPKYEAYFQAVRALSPSTMKDEQVVRDWLDIFAMSPFSSILTPSQLKMDVIPAGRLEAYRNIKCPCLVVAFADDIIVPPHLSREVADRIPNSSYVEIAECGHYGYLERPAEVNNAIVGYLRDTPVSGADSTDRSA
jgi:pimeloyl-ACP methyl ester carboxylesterase